MPERRVVIVGAGIGGLACAVDLAARGVAVTVLEQATTAGGKLRAIDVGGHVIDSGPTVFTMRWVFEALFADAGANFAHLVPMQPLPILARHAWSRAERFDLHADARVAAEAVAAFAGAAEADGFRAFCRDARAIYATLRDSFLTAHRAGPLGLAQRIGFHRPQALFGMRPFARLWDALGDYFHDPRLRQLFGRYATYVGSSPFAAPATLMLIAHVEQDGVWAIVGGMRRLAKALEQLAAAKGVIFRYGAPVTEITCRQGRAVGVTLGDGEMLAADAVVLNGDAAALAAGNFGAAVRGATKPMPPPARSLSALTWSAWARTEGFPLRRHNVFFSRDYAAEFDDIFRKRRLPSAPTVYVCAQDRETGHDSPGSAPRDERLLILVNAPADGDAGAMDAAEVAACEARVTALLADCGLTLQMPPAQTVRTTPAMFHRLFPATGGALYGRANHGWWASFQRPGAATAIPGLYLAGGSTHPGAGVPMAALSGRLAAQRLIADLPSIAPSHRVVTSGGISTPQATTASTP